MMIAIARTSDAASARLAAAPLAVPLVTIMSRAYRHGGVGHNHPLGRTVTGDRGRSR